MHLTHNNISELITQQQNISFNSQLKLGKHILFNYKENTRLFSSADCMLPKPKKTKQINIQNLVSKHFKNDKVLVNQILQGHNSHIFIRNRSVFSLTLCYKTFIHWEKNSGTQHGIQIYVKHNPAHSNFCTRDTILTFNKSLRLGNRFWRFRVFYSPCWSWSEAELAPSLLPSLLSELPSCILSAALWASPWLPHSLWIHGTKKKKNNYQSERPHSSHFGKPEDNNSIYLSPKKKKPIHTSNSYRLNYNPDSKS